MQKNWTRKEIKRSNAIGRSVRTFESEIQIDQWCGLAHAFGDDECLTQTEYKWKNIVVMPPKAKADIPRSSRQKSPPRPCQCHPQYNYNRYPKDSFGIYLPQKQTFRKDNITTTPVLSMDNMGNSVSGIQENEENQNKHLPT
ncbi:unnamed protein product [Arctia plantaginis]|uniref:Uncharacterized protein n=1 Tax=Arctia plantaginis TaxID=874455 RepID=A0A8S1A5V6_ARCPL|nr:unnamed protein product [Arctia plantaginis]CAB3241513.1 unnamed protein product [Arctia plantaginis]